MLKEATEELKRMADTLSKRIEDMETKGKHRLAKDFRKILFKAQDLIDKCEEILELVRSEAKHV